VTARRTTLAAIGLALALGLAAAACGSSGPDVTERAAGTLHGGVQIVRAAAAAHDRGAATSAVDQLETTLGRLRAAGEVDSDAALRIRHAIDRVRAELRSIPTTTTTTTTTTRPSATRPGGKHDSRHDRGHGNGDDEG
jgi:hypothetical protein